MSKVITSPVKKWAGTVTLADPLTLPQAEAIEAYFRHEIDPALIDKNGRLSFLEMDKPKMPVLFACVEKWQLADIPEDVNEQTFPHSPSKARHELVDWLYEEIVKIYLGESEIPNE